MNQLHSSYDYFYLGSPLAKIISDAWGGCQARMKGYELDVLGGQGLFN